jgi:predicted phage replisome organizer
MAEVKWIKLTTDMFDNRKIKHLRRLPDGNNIVLIWVMLLTMAGRCNSSGMIFLTENIPYTPKMLADELDFEENTVRLALDALAQLNMIVTDSGFFAIAGWEEYQNTDRLSEIREYNRLAKQKSRAKQKALQAPSEDVKDESMTSQRCHETDIEEDKEEDREEDKKSKRETTTTLFKRLLPEYQFSEALQEKLTEWIAYKTERREPYKEQGMKALLRQVENNCRQYGDLAVCSLIEDSMSNGWKGIIFDRLKNPNTRTNYQKQTKADELNDFYAMAAEWGSQ